MELTSLEAVIYNRVSRLVEGSRSIEDQDRENRAWCEREGVPVDRTFKDEGIGASRHSRKVRTAWNEVKDYLRPGHILVIWEASRAQRDLFDFAVLRNMCADMSVPVAYNGRVLDMNDSDDRFNAGLDALISEKETDKISERILRGKRTAAAAGRIPGRPPWGYRSVGAGKDATWVPDEAEAPRVQQAVRMLLNGDSLFTIMSWLRATPGYVPNNTTNLRRALTNPALAGLRQHQGEIVGKGVWAPIVTEAERDQMVARKERMALLRQFNSTPGPEPRWLSSGIAKCGECGAGLNRRAFKNGQKPCYSCRNGHVSRLQELVDDRVENAVFERLVYLDGRDYEQTDDDEITLIQNKIKELEDSLRDWKQEAIKGRVTPASFGEIEAGIENEKAEQRKKLRALLASDGERPTEADVRKAWPISTMREKRDLIKKLNMSVTVPRLRSAGYKALACDVIIEWPDF